MTASSHGDVGARLERKAFNAFGWEQRQTMKVLAAKVGDMEEYCCAVLHIQRRVSRSWHDDVRHAEIGEEEGVALPRHRGA